MNNLIKGLLVSAAAAWMLASCATSEPTRTLRANATDQADPVPAEFKNTGKTPGEQQVIPRTFDSQPPLIPHVAGYKIDGQTNRCLECHDRPFYKEEKAPKIGDSHYKGLDGKVRDKISSTRYFCNLCHVPQTNADALVENTFETVSEKGR